MARRRLWEFLPGETKDVAVSMDSELDSAAALTGTPDVDAFTRTAAKVYSAAAGFTISSVQVNTSILTTDGGEAIAVGRGIACRITAPSTQGTYFIRSQCSGDDGTEPAREDELVVSGPPAA